MNHINRKFIDKFWNIMGRLERMQSKLYEDGRCERDIFTRRVAKLFIKEGTYRIAIAGKFYIAIVSPVFVRFAYARNDKITLDLYSRFADTQTITIDHNDSLRISWEEISHEKFMEVADFCWGSIQDKFMNEYSSTHQYFANDIKKIHEHKTTSIIYDRLSGNITDDVLKGIADLINATEYWDETGFYINQDKKVRGRMPSGEAWFYLEDTKKIITKFGYLKYKEEGYHG